MTVVVRLTSGASEVERGLALRERVFCGEQGVSIEAERDGRDAEAAHLVAMEGERLVGTCRLLLAGGIVRLSRMAVDARSRRHGVGRTLLEGADAWAREAGAQRITLHAQMPAKSLYERAGYQVSGGPFMEEGIEHVLMEKALA